MSQGHLRTRMSHIGIKTLSRLRLLCAIGARAATAKLCDSTIVMGPWRDGFAVRGMPQQRQPTRQQPQQLRPRPRRPRLPLQPRLHPQQLRPQLQPRQLQPQPRQPQQPPLRPQLQLRLQPQQLRPQLQPRQLRPQPRQPQQPLQPLQPRLQPQQLRPQLQPRQQHLPRPQARQPPARQSVHWVSSEWTVVWMATSQSQVHRCATMSQAYLGTRMMRVCIKTLSRLPLSCAIGARAAKAKLCESTIVMGPWRDGFAVRGRQQPQQQLQPRQALPLLQPQQPQPQLQQPQPRLQPQQLRPQVQPQPLRP